MHSKSKKSVWAAILIVFFVSLLISHAEACLKEWTNNTIKIPKGRKAHASVRCSSSCVGEVTASSTDTSVATVTPASQTIGAEPKSFTIEGKKAGKAIVNIGWSCAAYGTGYLDPITVDVKKGKPKITKFKPKKGKPGTFVIIKGQNFDPTLAGNTVKIGGKKANVVGVKEDGTEITVEVPNGAATGKIEVATNEGSDTSKDTFTVE
ncbi:MAG: IPT/TIG domain-containing protein [Nitrospinae bacterium]|nr:IPT/TIG domain-containing protein [Nitrospinota bacterium]